MTAPDRDAWIAGYLIAAERWQDQHPCCQPDRQADAEREYDARFPGRFAGEDAPGNASPWGALCASTSRDRDGAPLRCDLPDGHDPDLNHRQFTVDGRAVALEWHE